MMPFRRALRRASDVRWIKLLPDSKRVTLLIAASDGLWDVVDRMPQEKSSIAAVVAHSLNQYSGGEQYVQKLSEKLTKWAAVNIADDVTVTVKSYKTSNCLDILIA